MARIREERLMKVTIAIVFAVSAVATLAGEPAPSWLERAGSLRSSDPALSRGRGNVAWRAWTAEAFKEASRERKPIFLFVTAPWCHAGQEMERKVFSDPETARRLSTDYIPVRLERDRFPETDLRIQQAVASLKGIRGWPLCVFMTCDGELFYGTTSLALTDDPEFGIPGLPSLLDQFSKRWSDDRTRISMEAASFCQALRRNAEQGSFRGPVPPDALAQHALQMQSLLDAAHGGFQSPLPAKFPAPRALEACLAHYAKTGDLKSLQVVTLTLNAMLDGGIYDQLEGGFHRLSTDPYWRVPRFEKMGLLNAEMAAVLLHAFQATHDGRYAVAAEQTLRFWLKTVDANDFFAASVAPSARSFEDGQLYTWSVSEIETLFGDERDIRLVRAYYGISAAGNQPAAPGRTVLTRARPLGEIAAELGLPVEEAARRIAAIRETMLLARNRRPQPEVDHTPLCDVNAMFVCVLLEAAHVLHRDEFSDRALKTLDALLNERGNDASTRRSPRHVLDDPASPALAFDEAAKTLACLSAYEAVADPAYRRMADETLKELDLRFRDVLHGGYVERSFKGSLDFAQALNWRTKSLQDTSEPSTNGLIAQAFLKMFLLTGEQRYAQRAETVVGNLGTLLASPSPYNATLVLAAEGIRSGGIRVKIIGNAADPAANAMLSAAKEGYVPWRSVMRFDTPEAAGEVPIANRDAARACALVTRGRETQVAETVDELKELFKPR